MKVFFVEKVIILLKKLRVMWRDFLNPGRNSGMLLNS